MPRGRPPGTKNKPKVDMPSAPTQPTPVRQQVRDLSGFGNQDALEAALPDSTATPGPTAEPVKVRKPRTPKVEMPDDPRYAKAVADMTSFGGGRAVKAAFKTAAAVMDNEEVALNPKEEEAWDDYFYVVGKKSNFDPTRPWYLIVYALVLLLEQVMMRVWKLNEKSFTNQLAKFFGFGGSMEEAEPEKEDETEKEDED